MLLVEDGAEERRDLRCGDVGRIAVEDRIDRQRHLVVRGMRLSCAMSADAREARSPLALRARDRLRAVFVDSWGRRTRRSRARVEERRRRSSTSSIESTKRRGGRHDPALATQAAIALAGVADIAQEDASADDDGDVGGRCESSTAIRPTSPHRRVAALLGAVSTRASSGTDRDNASTRTRSCR